MINTDVTRFVGDTWPITSTIKVNGNPVNLNGSKVYMYYNDVDTNGNPILVKIEGLIGAGGKVKFYPRDKYGINTADGSSYTPFNKAGTYDYSIVRENDIYELDDNGPYVVIDGVAVQYDSGNPEHEGLRRYSVFTEVMTHAVGTISVSNRVGV